MATEGVIPVAARPDQTRARRVAQSGATAGFIVVIALLGWLLLRPSPIPDSYWALIWGQEMLNGQLPQVDVPGAPSAHPLGVLVGTVVGLVGRTGAVGLFNGLVLLSLGGALVGIFRLSQVTFGTRVAWVALAAALCNFTLANVVMFSSLDVTAFALVVWAALLVAIRPRRGVAPLVLLGIAGLQRPEFWILSAAYWLYLAAPPGDRRRAVPLVLLAVAPVACWAAFDLLVANSFDKSLTQIQAVAEGTGERSAPILTQLAGAVPPSFPVPLMPVALAGMALAFWMRERTAILPAAIAFLGALAVGVYFLADIIVVGRFLIIPSLMATLFIGYAVVGGIGRQDRLGQAWRVGGILAGVLLLVAGVRQVDGVGQTRETLGDDSRASAAEFTRLIRQPRAARLLRRCTPVWTQSENPATLYLSGVNTRDYRLALTVPTLGKRGELPGRGVLVGGLPLQGLPESAGTYRLVVPPGFARVGAAGRWTLYERGC